MKTEHILVIRFSAMGDVAMAVPVIDSLAKQYPEVRITVLSRPFARVLFEKLPPNVGFMAADIKKEYRGVGGLNAFYRRLAAKRFTAVADLHDVLRSKYLRMRFCLSRNKVAHINKQRRGKRWLTAKHCKKLVQQPTAFQNYADVFARLGYPVKLDFRSIFPPSGGNLQLLPAPIGSKKSFQQWIGVAPFAAHRGKIYPLSKMEEVIDLLTQRHSSCRIFLFGGGETERKQLADMAVRHVQCICVPDVLAGLEQELILMSHLDAMISMDSSNMHLASLTATQVVSVWGATHPLAGFMGWNQLADNAVQLDLPCRPCSVYGNKPCLRGDYACLNDITPAQIADQVERILQTRL